MTRRACWHIAASVYRSVSPESQASPGMVHTLLGRPLPSSTNFSSIYTSATLHQPRLRSRLAGLSPASALVIAARLVAEPGSKKASEKQVKPDVQLSNPTSLQDGSLKSTRRCEATAGTKAVKSARKPRDTSDLRCVHGVGPKNEQLLKNIGLSSVASLKEVYRIEHNENKEALKQYLQVPNNPTGVMRGTCGCQLGAPWLSASFVP